MLNKSISPAHSPSGHRPFFKKPRFLIALFLVFSALAAIVALDPVSLRDEVEGFVDYIADYPILFFIAMVVLPGLGIPSTPFFILAGLVFVPMLGPLSTILLITAALTLNILWTYLLAVGPGRRMVAKILRKKADRLPALSEANRLYIVCLLRISPMIPLFIQNYFLGLARVPLRQNLIVGAIAQAIYASLFITFGKALFSGKEGTTFFIVLAIATTFLLGFALHKELKRQTQTDEVSHE